MFETKKIHRSNSAFSRLVSVEQRTDKNLGGVGGYTLEKIVSTDLHKQEKQPKTKVGGGATRPSPGGATGKKEEKFAK